jgi:hypothetical protein
VLQQVVVCQGQVVGAQHQVAAHPVAPHLPNQQKLLVVFEVPQQLASLELQRQDCQPNSKKVHHLLVGSHINH